MHAEELKKRTRSFAVRMINLVDQLPDSSATRAVANQIVRSGTSVGANHRAACRAKSRADFISKLGNVNEECDETIHCMELLIESGKIKPSLVSDLMHEAGEILAIIVASINTASGNQNLQSAIRNHQ